MAISYSWDAIATAIAALTISVTGRTGVAANLTIRDLGHVADTTENSDTPLLEPAIEAFVAGGVDEPESFGAAGTAVYASTYTLKYWYHHCPIGATRSGSQYSVENQRLYTNVAAIIAAIEGVDTTIINTKEIRIVPSTSVEPGEIEGKGSTGPGWGGNTYGCPIFISVSEWQNL